MILTKYTDLAVCWPEMKVHRSLEKPGCTEFNRKAKQDIQSTIKVGQNHLKYIFWTLSRRFCPKILILAFLWPKMKVHGSD